MQRCPLLFQVDLYDFLRIVPGAAGIGHEDGLVESEDRNRDEIANKEERLIEGERKGSEENGEKDVEHSLLRVLRADFYHLLTVGDRCLFRTLQFNVRLDELDRAICAGGDRLRRRAGEPVDHCATGDQPEQEWRVQQGEVLYVTG